MLTELSTFLLVNPWIYDFSAYDFWAKPLGLLYIASILRSMGKEVFFFDCTDPFNPYSSLAPPKRRSDGRGKYPAVEVEKPEALSRIPRKYKRYGVDEEGFLKFLEDLDVVPDAVFITTRMTYWYLGALRVVEMVREVFSSTRILVGGVYPKLCRKHAEGILGKDCVFSGYDLSPLLGFNLSFSRFPPPAFDLYKKLYYTVFMMGLGCPFRCSYCATPLLFPKLERKDPEVSFRELCWLVEVAETENVAIYDDAFLFDAERFSKPFLRLVAESGLNIRFHNPNGLHARFIDDELSVLLAALFEKVFLSLESLSYGSGKLHEKVTKLEFERAVDSLLKAGFSHDRIGVYLLVGLPGQSFGEALSDVDYVLSLGLRPSLSEYSPIPETPLFELAKRLSRYPLDEPLFQNNSIFPMENERFKREDLDWLKRHARGQ